MIIPEIPGPTGVLDYNNGTQRFYNTMRSDLRLIANGALGHLPVGNSAPRVDVWDFTEGGKNYVYVQSLDSKPLSEDERRALRDRFLRYGYEMSESPVGVPSCRAPELRRPSPA